jgi:hypothetical protein
MNGPEHYAAAEQWMQKATELMPDISPPEYAIFLQRAQVHATLALAAATAKPDAEYEYDVVVLP